MSVQTCLGPCRPFRTCTTPLGAGEGAKASKIILLYIHALYIIGSSGQVKLYDGVPGHLTPPPSHPPGAGEGVKASKIDLSCHFAMYT